MEHPGVELRGWAGVVHERGPTTAQSHCARLHTSPSSSPRNPSPTPVLGVSGILEGYSLWVATRVVVAGAASRKMGLLQYIKRWAAAAGGGTAQERARSQRCALCWHLSKHDRLENVVAASYPLAHSVWQHPCCMARAERLRAITAPCASHQSNQHAHPRYPPPPAAWTPPLWRS